MNKQEKLNKDNKKAAPPVWAERFLAWYCKEDLLEDLQGDLNEYFERNLKSKGIVRAKLIYMIDVLKFLRLYTIRKPKFVNLIIQWIMIGSYIKTSSRSIVRNKLFSAINIIGLAVSMSVGLLVIAFVSDLFSYDDFHEKKDRIYRVITRSEYLDERPMQFASTSVKAGKRIQEDISGVEDVTILRNGFGGDASVGETSLPVSALWASESFFKVFTFPLIHGNPGTALKEPYSLVLTEKTSKKLFGSADALGNSVKFDTVNYTVTGIVKDVPQFSHLQFEALVSFSTAELQKPDGDGNFLSWANIYSNYVYLVLPENGNAEGLKANLDKLSMEENKGLKNRKVTISLQPLKEIALGENLSNPIGPVMVPLVVWILGGLAFIIILSACFNYTNLSIARSLRRSREVGIRKVMGALKGHVLGQFISESVIVSLLALIISFFLFLFLRIQFLSLDSHIEELVSLNISARTILYFVVLAIGVGVVAGFLPALFFSRINAIQVLKNVSTLKVFRHVSMRKALIVVQYTFSLIFITTTIVGYSQYKSFLTFDLGFTTENILNIKLQGNKSELMIKELSELPEVSKISQSRIITSIGSMYGTHAKFNNPEDSALVWLNFIDENHLPLHNHKFLTGKNFESKPGKTEETEVIVNEQLLKRFDIAKRDPLKALGEQLTVDGKKLVIIGVLKNFHYGTVENKIEPMIFRYSSNEPGGYLNVKIASSDWPTTLGSIEAAWKKIDKVHTLDAKFYDEQIARNYSQFSVIVKVIGFLAFLAICIASMGLFGMVVFTTETKLKEISIRKVLGANEGSLVYLLSKGFLILLAVSALIALPATYFFFDQVVLTNFVYHQPIGWIELLAGATAIGVLAFIMIGSQTLKAARSNPAEVLKNE